MAEPSAHDVVIQTQSVGQDVPTDVSGTIHEPDFTGDSEGRIVAGDHDAKTSKQSDSLGIPATSNSSTTNALSYMANTDAVVDINHIAADDTNADQETRPEGQQTGAGAVDSQLANGDIGSNLGSEDAGLDAYPGSDTEASRSGSVGPPKEGVVTRERSDSVKKTVPSFKTVSVTKNFLAKTGAGSASAAKAAVDKAVPAPAPKQFTDEELKQQYGIHLATRLQADEDGKDAKWADIDDDEDDWAPETVQWMDGTKSTITPSENPLLLAADSGGLVSTQADPTTQTGPAPPPPSSTAAPGKTILRPGVRTQVTQTKPGLVLKGVPEKPVLLAKPSANSVVKSPWAALPPVDKVSPVTFVPPAVGPARQADRTADAKDVHDDWDLQRPDAHFAPMPAREIAADDFNRNWRENEQGNRELYNSQSGRYETVRPTRRPSRQEPGFRPPAVLQRPSYSSNHSHPEPSAAFQSSRDSAGEDKSGWNRRHGSIPQDDRYGYQDRRTPVDQASGSVLPPAAQPGLTSLVQPAKESTEMPSPAIQPVTEQITSQPQSKAATSSTAQETQSGHTAGDSNVNSNNASQSADVRAVQQQLMKGKIAFNRKRKQEEEAKEEVAKKERIRLKLEALAAAKPLEDKPEEKPEQAIGRSGGQTAKQYVAGTEAGDAITRSPQRPPTMSPAIRSNQQTPLASPPSLPPQSSHTAKRQSPMTESEPISEVVTDNAAVEDSAALPKEAVSGTDMPSHSAISRHQPWKPAPVSLDQESGGWATKRTNNRSVSGGSNVWGPPTNDRTLGNGAFEAEFQRIGPPPGPIAPPSQNQTPVIPSEPLGSATVGPSSLFSPSSHIDSALPLLSSSFHQHPRSPPLDMFQRRPRPDVRAAKIGWHNLAAQLPQLDALEAKERTDREREARLNVDSSSTLQPIYKETFRQTTAGSSLGHRKVVAVAKTLHEAPAAATESRVSMPLPGAYVNPPSKHASPPHPISNGRASRFFGPGIDRPLGSGIRAHINVSMGSESFSPPPPDGSGHPAFEGDLRNPRVNLPHPLPKVRLPPSATITAPASPELVVIAPRNSGFRTGAQPIVNQLAWQDRFNGLFGRAQPLSPVATAAALAEIADITPPALLAKSDNLAISSSSKAPLDVSSAQNTTTVSLPQNSASTKSSNVDSASLVFMVESKPAEDELMDDREPWSSPTVVIPKSAYPNAVEMLGSLAYRYMPSKFAPMEGAYEFSSTSFPIPFEFLESELFTEAGYTILISLVGGFRSQKFVNRKLANEGTALRNGKGPRNKKHQTPTRGPPSGSQSPRAAAEGNNRAGELSSQVDGEQRGPWAKPLNNNRYRQGKHPDATLRQGATPGSLEHGLAQTTSKSGWAKPAKGGRANAFSKRA